MFVQVQDIRVSRGGAKFGTLNKHLPEVWDVRARALAPVGRAPPHTVRGRRQDEPPTSGGCVSAHAGWRNGQGCGRARAACAQMGDNFDICPNWGQLRRAFDRIGAKNGVGQTSAKFDQDMSEIDQRPSEHDPDRLNFRSRPTSAITLPQSSELGTELTKFGAEFNPIWPELG